ncbi:MAG TPA: hypothetical protein ENK49_09035 [Gammaproteobacteria bacterium]|nr:hypothetical protein [Gammaproteobacteria bacterium]
MADLFTVTAPLAIRYRDGRRQVMVERLPYRDGLLYLPPFWTDQEFGDALHFVPGPIKGEGPWKVGDAVVTVLGCHGTDAGLADAFSGWQARLMELAEDYPQRTLIEKLMKTHAAGAAGPVDCHPAFDTRKP